MELFSNFNNHGKLVLHELYSHAVEVLIIVLQCVLLELMLHLCLLQITFNNLSSPSFFCRKRAKNKGQFKNLVKGAKKGAAKGQKMRKKPA